MSITKHLVIIIGAAALLAASWWLIAHRRQLPPAGSGAQQLRSIPAEAIFLDAAEIVTNGSSRVLALRFDGQVELVPHHFVNEDSEAPLTIDEWAERLGAPVVFNAGQYDENLSHLGWLKQNGEWLVPHRHAAWQALLLSGPTDGAAWARIADLAQAETGVEKRYRQVIQSMMLVDDTGRIRVRRSHKSACRTIVAEDTLGRILVIVTEGAVVLADLAEWLLQQDLGILRAMNLDGGVESQLAVSTPELTFSFYGQHSSGIQGGRLRHGLPTVVAVRPLAGARR